MYENWGLPDWGEEVEEGERCRVRMIRAADK